MLPIVMSLVFAVPQAPMPPQAPPAWAHCSDACDCGCVEGGPCTCGKATPAAFTETAAQAPPVGPRHGDVDGAWTYDGSKGVWWRMATAAEVQACQPAMVATYQPMYQPMPAMQSYAMPMMSQGGYYGGGFSGGYGGGACSGGG